MNRKSVDEWRSVKALLIFVFGVHATEAEDLTQEVLIAAWRHDQQGFERRALLYGISRNIAANYRERDQRRAEAHGLLAHEASFVVPSPEDLCTARTSAVNMRAALEQVRTSRPELYEAATLYFLEGLGGAEAATRVGVPYGTMLSRIRAAVREVSAILARESAAELVPRRRFMRESCLQLACSSLRW